MEYLPLGNRVQAGDIDAPAITATGKNVIIIGGGDTAADCLGTANRQGALSVTQLDIMPRPPAERSRAAVADVPEGLPRQHRARGGRRATSSPRPPSPSRATERPRSARAAGHAGDGGRRPGARHGARASCRRPRAARDGLPRRGPPSGRLAPARRARDARGDVARDAAYASPVDGVFVAGDAGRGQSLIVWAIAEGRSAAAASVDQYLRALDRPDLPVAIPPTARPLT